MIATYKDGYLLGLIQIQSWLGIGGSGCQQKRGINSVHFVLAIAVVVLYPFTFFCVYYEWQRTLFFADAEQQWFD